MPRGVRRLKRKAFRPRPYIPRPTFGRVRKYARFYGLYRSKTGKTKCFAFQVYLSPKIDNRQIQRYMVVVCNLLLDRNLPVHKSGEVFSSFRDLIWGTKWVRIRKLLSYEAGVEYER